jgi:hypothetical protein
VHEYDRGDAGRFGRRNGAEQDEVDYDDVRWHLPKLQRELLGPGRGPQSRLCLALNNAERLRDPLSDQTANWRRMVERVAGEIREWSDSGSGGTNPPKKCRAHREPTQADAGSRQNPNLMATRNQARHHRQDERDVAAALKHRDEDSG